MDLNSLPKNASSLKFSKYNVPLNKVDMLENAENMSGKWQLLIFLGQQTIINQQNGKATIRS